MSVLLLLFLILFVIVIYLFYIPILSALSYIFRSLIYLHESLWFLIFNLDLKAYLILTLFLIGIIGLILSFIYLVFKKNSVRKYGYQPDSWLKTKIKIFFGFSKEKDSVEEYFNKSNVLLKSFLKGKSYKYELPWYLTFGLERSGKSSFLNFVNLEHPIEMKVNNDNYLNHYFFNDGIIIDVKSELICNNPGDDFSWDRLLKNLKNIRKEKSIDGIIYFVSIKDLISDNVNEISKIKKESEFLYFKLWQMQSMFDMQIPIYFVFTHLDILEGYSEFIDKFIMCKDDIFGWSNPHPLTSKFDESWINSMYFDLEENLKFLLSEVMINYSDEVSFNIMNFINSFKNIRTEITDFLMNTFKYNKYSKGLYFRGAYFTSIEKISVIKENIPYLENDDVEFMNDSSENGALYFGKNLLTKKIFPEKNIGKSEIDLKRVNAQIFNLQCFNIAFAIGGSYNLYKINNDMIYIKEDIIPKINKLTEILNRHKENSNYIDSNEFLSELSLILSNLKDVSLYSIKFYGVPSSYFSTLSRNQTKLCSSVYSELIINSLYKNIEKKYEYLSKQRYLIVDNKKDNFLDFKNMTEFINLKNLVNQVSLLESYENKLKGIIEYKNVEHLKFLVKEFYDNEITNEFAHEIISENIIVQDNITSKIDVYKKEVKKVFNWSVNNFKDKCFSYNRVDNYFKELYQLLSCVDNEVKDITYNNIKSIQVGISNLIDLYSNEEFSWLRNKSFSSEKVHNILEQISESTLLGGADTSIRIYEIISTSYKNFKIYLEKYTLPMIGRPFYFDNKQIKINYSVLSLHGTLNNIFSEPFMDIYKDSTIDRLNPNQHIYWDTVLMKQNAEMISKYREFVKLRPNNKFEKILQIVASKNIKNIVLYKMKKANKTVLLKNDKTFLKQCAINIASSADSINEILTFLKEVDFKTFNEIKIIQKFNLKAYLGCINQCLEYDALYQFKKESLGIDVANKKMYFRINLQDYLETQKEQLSYYVEDLAMPAVKCLESIKVISDSSKTTVVAFKFNQLAKDLANYKLNPANSKLYRMEAFYNSLNSEPLILLMKDINSTEVDYDRTRYLDCKMGYLKTTVKSFLLSSIDGLLLDQSIMVGKFLMEYAKVFPFDLNGTLLGLTGSDYMSNLVNEQKSSLEFIRIIEPHYQSFAFELVDSLSRYSKLVKYIRHDNEYIIMKFKKYQSIAETKEKNLQYLIDFSAKINNGDSIALFSGEELRVYDTVEFNIDIAKGYGLKIVPINKQGYRVINYTRLQLTLNRKEFVRFLIENTIVMNEQTFIGFTIQFEDDKGIKDDLIVLIPVDLTVDGLPFAVSNKSFDDLMKENIKMMSKQMG